MRVHRKPSLHLPSVSLEGWKRLENSLKDSCGAVNCGHWAEGAGGGGGLQKEREVSETLFLAIPLHGFIDCGEDVLPFNS